MAGMHTPAISPRRRLFALLEAERGDLWVAVIFSIAIGLLTLAVPIATQALVNTIAFGNLRQPLIILSFLVLSVLVISAILQLFRFRVVETLQRRLFVRLASESVGRLLHSSTAALKMRNGPEIVNLFLDVVTVQKAAATLLVDGLSVVMQTLVGMILLGIYHPWLLMFDAVILAALLTVIFPLGFHGVGTAVKESKAKYALVGWLEEIARNATTFRGKAQAQFAFERADALVRDYLACRGKHFSVLLRQFAGSLGMQALGSAALLGVGGALVVERQLTLGQLVAAELVVAAVLSGIAKLAKHLETYYDLLAGLDKLGTLTDIEVERSGSEPPPHPAGPMRVVHRTPHRVLTIEPGEKIGLAGLSGSGKSTLLDFIGGYSELPGTSVELDGVDLRRLRLEDVRSQIALVRGPELFHGTILENVCIGRDLSSADVQRALEQVGVWSAIQRFPAGLDTLLATGGAPLSEGAKQALIIARAIVGKPRLLMIDEALDAVQDTAERERLTDLLFDPQAPWTLILVTSRPEFLRLCSRVYHMDREWIGEAA
jgi:putative ABC transport system ATP-binding protein